MAKFFGIPAFAYVAADGSTLDSNGGGDSAARHARAQTLAETFEMVSQD
jgi:hypothetical protein